MQKNAAEDNSCVFESLYLFREPGISCVSFCEDGKLLALGASQEILLYELASGEVTKRIRISQEPETIFVTKQGQIAVSGAPASDKQNNDTSGYSEQVLSRYDAGSYIRLYSPDDNAEPLSLRCGHDSMKGSVEFVHVFMEGEDGTLSGICKTSVPVDQDVDGSEFYEDYDYRVIWDTANGNILSVTESQKNASVAAASGDDNLLLLLGSKGSQLFRVHSKMIRPGYRICNSDMKMPQAHNDGESILSAGNTGMLYIKGIRRNLTDAELTALRSGNAETGVQQGEMPPAAVGGRIMCDYDKDYDPGHDERFMAMYEDAFGEQYDPCTVPQIPVVSLFFAGEKTPCYTLFLPEIYPFAYRKEIFVSASFSSGDKTFTVVTKAASYTFELSSGRCMAISTREEAR